MSPYLNDNWIFLGRWNSLWQKGLFDFIQSPLSAQSRTYFEDLRSSFSMKSVCSGPYQVTLQVSPVVILEPALMFFMNIYFLQLQMWISCVTACIHSLICGKPSVSVSPTHSHQAAARVPSLPFCRLSNPSSQASLGPLCAPALPSLCPTAGLHPAPQPFSPLLGSPNWGQWSRCSLSSAKEWGGIAALSTTPVVSWIQLGFLVLVTTWWSCQDMFWTVRSVKITSEIVR